MKHLEATVHPVDPVDFPVLSFHDHLVGED
jgi:hypothetical protein